MAAMVAQLKSLWEGLGKPQKILVTAGGIAVISVLVFGVFLGTQTEWRVLATGLAREDASALMTSLEENGIPFRLTAQGTGLDVDASRFGDAQRLAVVAGISSGGEQAGWRMLDGGDHWRDTRDQYEMRKRIALEQELANTVLKLQDVRAAKVHITPASKSFNRRDTKPAKAAVTVGVRPGRQLSASSVEAIVQIVAHAVEGLVPESVVVTDDRGMVLTRSDGATRADLLRLETVRAKEQDLQESAITALSRALGGTDKVSVRVSLELDNEKIETTRREIDSTGRVTTTEKITSSQNSSSKPGGTVSTAAVQGGRSLGGRGGDSKEEEMEASYDHPTTTVHSVKEAGTIKRMTVGVMVDESFKDRKTEIESVVMGMVGFKEGRDYLSVGFFPMAGGGEVAAAAPVAAAGPGGIDEGILSWIGLGVPIAVGLFALLWFWRSAASARKALVNYMDTPTSEEQAAMDKARAERERVPDPKDDIVRLVDENPDAVGRLLRSWIYEPVNS